MDRTTFILLHAAGSSPRALGKLAAKLEGEGFHVAAPVLPMSVTATEVREADALAGHLAIVAEAVAAAGGGRKILFGHSFGGLVALLALLAGTEVEMAILYEPIVLSVLDDASPGDRAARAWDRALIDALQACVTDGAPEAGIRGFIEAYNEVRWDELPQKAKALIIAEAVAICHLTQAVHHLQIDRQKLTSLATRVLIMNGSRSPDITKRMAASLALLLPNVALYSIRDAGHMGPVLAPEDVANEMLAFLS